jgi:hypothetical protein
MHTDLDQLYPVTSVLFLSIVILVIEDSQLSAQADVK